MRLFSQKMIKRFAQDDFLNLEPESISLLIKEGAKVGEVQVEMRERQAGGELPQPLKIRFLYASCLRIHSLRSVV